MTAFTNELWIEYGIGMVFFVLRFYARITIVGIRNLQWEDAFFGAAMCLWTVDATTVSLIAANGSFVGLTEETANALSDEEAKKLAIGSKALFTAWLSYTTLIWSMKGALLCFYSRLTLGLWQGKLVKVMGGLSVAGYLACIFVLLGHCTPIKKNWQIKPYAGDKCTLTVANYIIVAAANVLTDLGILCIPLPLIWTVKIPLRRKIILALLLSSGLFVITAALLRCILTLQNIRVINNSTIWGIRETFVSLIAISIPAIKPLFNQSRWMPGSSRDKSSQIKSSQGPFSKFGHSRSGKEGTVIEISQKGHDLEANDWSSNKTGVASDLELKELSRHGSEDQIIGSSSTSANPKSIGLAINVTTVYATKTESDSQRRASGSTISEENEMARHKPADDPFANPRPSKGGWGQSTTMVTASQGGSKKLDRIFGTST